MKYLLALLGLAVVTAGCSGESSFPEPTGKGTVRALNAIKGSPDVTFRIEERVQERLAYKQSSNGRRWDDFEYTFNFDASFAGEANARRVASSTLKVEAGQDLTLVLTGNIASPDILFWRGPERSFEEAQTVFEMRFAHAATSLGSVDVYFAAPGTVPVAGEQRGSLGFGEILAPLEFAAGPYVLTLTAAGDPATVVYESDEVTYAERDAFIVPLLEGDENDVAPFTVRLVNTAGGSLPLPDIRFDPTVRFFQASQDLPAVDVYDDELLTNQVLSNHVFGDITADLQGTVGTTQLTYTAAGNPGAVQFEDSLNLAAGTHTNYILVGTEGSRVAAAYVPDRRSVSTLAQLQIFPASANQQSLDLYVVDAGEPIDDTMRRGTLAYTLSTGNLPIDAGSSDVYLTVFDEQTVLAGPVRLEARLGDVIEAIVLDTTDPALVEFRIVPPP